MGSGRYDHDWRDDRGQRAPYDEHRTFRGQGSGGPRGERGFFERAGDEISSWFGDDEAERRREMDERSGRSRGEYRAEPDRYGRSADPRRPPRYRDDGDRRPYGYDRGELAGSGRAPDMDREQHYRPMTGDYGRSASPQRPDRERSDFGAFGSTQAAGSAAGATTNAHDRHYNEWRQRQIEEIDRDYEDYRREHQSKFESDFSNWRSTRQAKRQLLGQIKEHMQVVGSDDQPLGTVDKVRGDRVILTKADSPDGQHHSLNCAMIDRVEGDRVILDKKADDAKALFGSEERDRALFERDDNREPGAHILNRSFSGTY
jgi:hypothetical protein